MTANEDLVINPETLARDAQRVLQFSHNLQARVVEVAEALARTEESIAATMDWLADQQPERAERLKARVVEVAEALAKTEESIAATMDWLASQQPERAERLKALGEAARKQAAQARRWGEDRSEVADEAEPRRRPGPR